MLHAPVTDAEITVGQDQALPVQQCVIFYL